MNERVVRGWRQAVQADSIWSGESTVRSESIGPQSHYLNNHSHLVTADLDHARESMDRMWERHRSVLKRGRTYGLRWHQAELVDTTLSYGHSPSALHVECGPMSDAFRVTMHETGRINHWVDGQRATATRKRGVLHRPGQELTLETEPFALLLLTFDGSYVRRCLQQRWDGPSPTVDWPTDFSLNTRSGRALKELTRWMAGELDRPDSVILTSGVAARSLERTLLTLFLDCMSEAGSVKELDPDYLNEPRVRRIEDWIDAHFAEPIGIEDLARIGGVSVRSVQTAFRRLRACTPMQVLHNRRLDAAHAMLRRAEPGTTVTQVAADCGIFNFGRFSHRFRERFGETPSRILARAMAR